MGFGDRIRRFFAKKGNPALGQLEEFARERKGVEGYIEPRTHTNPTTLLLVDRDGEHLRAQVEDPDAAVAFCEGLAIPVYDAQVLGYPQRMRDYERRRRTEATQGLDDAIADLERQFAEEPPP
jgi:hypothetical protein